MIRGIVIAAVIALGGAGCGGDSAVRGGGDARVGVVIKGLDNPFFAAMKQGVQAEAGARRADVRVGAATGLQDTAGQAAKLEALLAEELDCYVVNPINQANLLRALSHVPEGTPIVNIDSPVGTEEARALGIEIATYIGTDNKATGATLPAHVDAPIQVITKGNVARAEARFPQPAEPFEDPFARRG